MDSLVVEAVWELKEENIRLLQDLGFQKWCLGIHFLWFYKLQENSLLSFGILCLCFDTMFFFLCHLHFSEKQNS